MLKKSKKIIALVVIIAVTAHVTYVLSNKFD